MERVFGLVLMRKIFYIIEIFGDNKWKVKRNNKVIVMIFFMLLDFLGSLGVL